MYTQLLKRLKSFTWRLAMAVIAFGVAWMAENIGLLELPLQATIVLGLILGEVSKYLNTPEKI